MLKFILTASALAITAPAIAQTAQDQSQTTAKTGSAASTIETPAAQDSTVSPKTDPTTTAAAQPTTGDAVAQVVDSGWSTYDTNGDGKLSFTEFAAWMNKVKADSDPKLDPASATTRQWNKGAFAQADADKSKSVSKAELTAFLSKGQPGS